jgi:hypothetical protein
MLFREPVVPQDEFVQQPVAQLPWGHNVRLLDLVKDREQRLWLPELLSSTGGAGMFW